MTFRKLKADEIDVRVASVFAQGVTVLLYKDARVDQNVLDETVGPMNWQREHKEVKGNLFCYVSLWDAKKNMWITKSDCGVESYSEKVKGEASDSFKRACFNWGIGRELYTAPFMWIPAQLCDIEEKGGKYNCRTKFYVSEISYNEDGRISALTVLSHKKKDGNKKEWIRAYTMAGGY